MGFVRSGRAVAAIEPRAATLVCGGWIPEACRKNAQKNMNTTTNTNGTPLTNENIEKELARVLALQCSYKYPKLGNYIHTYPKLNPSKSLEILKTGGGL